MNNNAILAVIPRAAAMMADAYETRGREYSQSIDDYERRITELYDAINNVLFAAYPNGPDSIPEGVIRALADHTDVYEIGWPE